MKDNHEDIIARYREKYTDLAEKALPGSAEQRAYHQIVQLIDLHQKVHPQERAFRLTIAFMTSAHSASPSAIRAIFKQCTLDFARDTEQETLEW